MARLSHPNVAVVHDGGSFRGQLFLAMEYVAGTDKPFADAMFRASAQSLDLASARWTQTYREVCEATWLLGEQSEELLDLRMACLENRRTAMRALTTTLASADATVVERALGAAAEETLVRAIGFAEEAEATRSGAQAWINLVFVQGYLLAHVPEPHRSQIVARAMLHRMGPDLDLEAELENANATTLRTEGRSRFAKVRGAQWEGQRKGPGKGD